MNARVIATIVIWVILAAVLSITLTSTTGAIAQAQSGAAVFGMVLVLTIAATLSTLAIWTAGQGHPQEVQLAKAKRNPRARVERLIESLDDDEVYELEALLLRREDDSQNHTQGS